MDILNLIVNNWDSVLVVLAVVGVLVFLLVRGNKKVVYKILYSLVTEAEKQYGGGTGTLKQATVIGWVYDRLPAVVRMFVSAKTLAKWVDEVVETAKAHWDNGILCIEFARCQEATKLSTKCTIY